MWYYFSTTWLTPQKKYHMVKGGLDAIRFSLYKERDAIPFFKKIKEISTKLRRVIFFISLPHVWFSKFGADIWGGKFLHHTHVVVLMDSRSRSTFFRRPCWDRS